MPAPAQAAGGGRRKGFLSLSRLSQLSLSLLLLLLLCAALPLSLRAQNLNIAGTVRDDKGDPVVGASVVVKGTTVGVTTDATGSYAISAPADATLVFSFLGLATLEEAVAGRGRIDVVLSESDQTIDEVMVVGYGTQKKITLTGSVVAVSGDKLLKTPATTIGRSLAGRLPGVRVRDVGGRPGEDAIVDVRGFSSGSGALIIVDGIEQAGVQIDPNEVESI